MKPHPSEDWGVRMHPNGLWLLPSNFGKYRWGSADKAMGFSRHAAEAIVASMKEKNTQYREVTAQWLG